MTKKILSFLQFLLLIYVIPSAVADNNMHIIDRDELTGFEIYRYSRPEVEDVFKLCALGVREIMVLSGDAKKYDEKYMHYCPGMKVIYNFKQNERKAITKEFLDFFDEWVEQARVDGKKIAFRCTCGCHRTGRLAAYYRMKYQHWSTQKAIAEMNRLGKWMWFFPELDNQVRAMSDYIAARPCSEKAKYCVVD